MSDIIQQRIVDTLKHVDAEIAKLTKQRSTLQGMLGVTNGSEPKPARKPAAKKAVPATGAAPAASKPAGDGRKSKGGAISTVLTMVEVRGEVHASEMLTYLQHHGYQSLTRKSLDATLSNESKRGNARLSRVEGKPSTWKITEHGKQEIDNGFQAPAVASDTPHPAQEAVGAGPRVY
jgi:hypothetical protein